MFSDPISFIEHRISHRRETPTSCNECKQLNKVCDHNKVQDYIKSNKISFSSQESLEEKNIKTENIKEEDIFCVPGIVSSEPNIKEEPCDIQDVKTENIFCFTGIQNRETCVDDVLEENDKTYICEDLAIKEEYEETNISEDPIKLTDDQIDIKEEQI